MSGKKEVKKKAVVDIDCKVGSAEVYSDSNYEYSCSLTFTDIGMNSNKFYIMQIIYTKIAVDACEFALYTKYGRTGEKGITSLKWFSSPQQAIKVFATQYRTKTSNTWGMKFNPVPNKYFHLKVDNFENNEEEESVVLSTQNNQNNIGDSITLNENVTYLIKLISDTNIHIEAIKSFGVDVKKMPLGKISNEVISEANGILYALSEINNAINDGTWERSKEMLKLEDSYMTTTIYNLSNAFWTRIPFVCGRTKPPIINTPYQIDRCAELLDLMKNSKIAGQIIKRNKNIFDIYKSINTDISLCTNAQEVNFVTNFVKGTKAPTHYYNLEVLEIFNVRKDIPDANNKFYETNNHMLLAHGSRMSNFLGILSTGLRVPNNNQVSNGAALGRGIYFADVISKSFNYCNSRDTQDIGFVLLCEVALGDKYDDHETIVSYNNSNLPKGYTSRRGLGQTTVTKLITHEYDVDNGETQSMMIPQGGLEEREGLSNSSSFLYNEFVIFDARQYRFRYLVKIKCCYV